MGISSGKQSQSVGVPLPKEGDGELTLAAGTQPGASAHFPLRPHLARLLTIKGVWGAIVLSNTGEVIESMLPEDLESNIADIGFLVHKALTQVEGVDAQSAGHIFRFQLASMFVRKVESNTILCLIDHDANVRQLRVGLRVFSLKLKLEATSPNSSDHTDAAPRVRTDVNRDSTAPEEHKESVGSSESSSSKLVEGLQTLLESYTKNGRAKAMVIRVLNSMNLSVDTLTTQAFPEVANYLTRFVRDAERRANFLQDSFYLLLSVEQQRADRQIANLSDRLRILSRGIEICNELITPHIGVDEKRDEEESVAQLAELMSQLAESHGAEVNLLNLGDRILAGQEELQYAASLQHSLTPDTKTTLHDSTGLASFFRPALHCGGDWWGVKELKNNRFVLAIADVTGHGVPAAILTGILKGAWDHASPDMGPSEILQLFNSSIYECFNKEMMATCAVTEIDLSSMTLRIASAGHNFPYLVRKTESKTTALSSLLARGNALGAESSPEYNETTVRVQEDDLIVWYTDGVTECMNPTGEQFGDKRFRRYFLGMDVDAPLEELRDNLLSLISQYCEHHPLEDDATLVLSRLKNPKN